MGKAVFGEFSAFDTQGGIRFMKAGKLASENAIPTEVVAFLRNKLTTVTPEEPESPAVEKPVQKFAPPSEEEKARLRAESLEVSPSLQASPAKLQEDAAALTQEDFALDDDEEDKELETLSFEDKTIPSAEQMHEISKVISDGPSGPHTIEDIDPPFPATSVEPDFLEQVSIHTASLEDITRALYERFGVYTVYLNQLPNPDEINPITGEMFTKYHQGIAYQAALSAQNRGILDRKPEEGRRLMDEGRTASANFAVDKVPETMGEARRADSFDFRTSVRGNESKSATEIVHITDENGVVHAIQRDIPAGQTGEFNGASSRFDEEEDERIVEPRMGKQVIRPNW